MSAELRLLCPVSGSVLERAGDELRAGGRTYACLGGVPDLRLAPGRPCPPAPLEPGDLEAFLAELSAGAELKPALERLLHALPLARSEALMLLMREARGSWHPLLPGRPGRALLVVNALSGMLPALVQAGHEVVVLDRSTERLAFGAHRTESLTGRRPTRILGGDTPLLPFEDACFDLVVLDEGAPTNARERGFPLEECRRVSRGDFLRIADNRLGYKRSSGRHGVFRVPGPVRYLADVLKPPAGERSLVGDRRRMRFEGWAEPRAWALYPHSRDFTFVVGIDTQLPELALGPKERSNRLKMFGRALGLFPVFAPSFAILSTTREAARGPRRVELVLAALARELGEARPEVEQYVSTRGNSTVLITRPVGGAGGVGRWVVHLPLSPRAATLLGHHDAMLARTRRLFPRVPVPEQLYAGELDGLRLSCERRLDGWNSGQLAGEREPCRRMVTEAGAHLAELVVTAPREVDEDLFERHVARRFAVVREHARPEGTRARLDTMLAEAREALLGTRLPLVHFHGDLRGKHVQVRPDGTILGYLDWGSAREEGLPVLDLIHLIVQQRRSEGPLSSGEAWEELRAPGGLRGYERAALEAYALATGVGEPAWRALCDLYPVVVASVAEEGWDYSRPHWVHREFGL